MHKFICVVAGALILPLICFGGDCWYFIDSGDNDISNYQNWHKDGFAGENPDPALWPMLDTATGGFTHPYFFLPQSGTLTIARQEFTMNDLVFYNPGTDFTIDLGARDSKLKLFGDCDAALWIGQNVPDGTRVTFKRGIIMNAAASQRNTAIRMGAIETTNKRMSSFTIDGPDAVVSNLCLDIQSPMCEFVVTNGGKAYIAGNYSMRMNQRLPGSRIVVSGTGSVIHQNTRDYNAIFFGDNITDPDNTSGGVVITDGGMITNANGTIGNRAGNFYVHMDRGVWEGTTIHLAASGDGTSTNNAFTAQNGSAVSLSDIFYVGTYGGYNTALFADSSLKAAAVSLGENNSGYGHNEMVMSDVDFSVAGFYCGGRGAAEGPNCCNNRLEIRDCTPDPLKTFNVYLSNSAGGSNSVLMADGSYTMGSVVIGRKGCGWNEFVATNCTIGGDFEVGGNAGVVASASSGNCARFIDCTLGTPENRTVTFRVANSNKGYPSASNRIELVNSTWYNNTTYCGIGGWSGNTRGNDFNSMIVDAGSTAVATNGIDGFRVGGYGFWNRLEVKNGSTFRADSIYLGYTHADYAFTGTNTLYVGKDSLAWTPSILQMSPGGNIVEIEDGTLRAKFLQLSYYYSDVKKTIDDNMEQAEKEFEKPAGEIWGSRFIFRGTKPVLRCPYDDSTEKSGRSGDEFDRSCIVTFELPEEPYANPPLQSSLKVAFYDGAVVNFDLSKVGITGGKYVLADMTEAGTLTVSTEQLAAMQANLTAAATAVGRKAKIYVDGKKLVCKVNSNLGTTIILR